MRIDGRVLYYLLFQSTLRRAPATYKRKGAKAERKRKKPFNFGSALLKLSWTVM